MARPPTTPPTRVRALVVAVAVATMTAGAPAPFATAQEQDATATITLLSQPVWHGPDTPLGLSIRIDNHGDDPIEGFRLQLSLYERVTTRTALEESVSGNPLFINSSEPRDFAGLDVAPGGSTTVRLTGAASELGTLGPAAAGGAYPLRIELLSLATFERLDGLVTQLVFYPSRPQAPLDIVAVVPLHAVPARAPDGVFGPDSDGVWPLEEAASPDGWLRRLVDAATVNAGRRLRLAVALGPRLVDELADMADGYARADPDGDVSTVPRTSAGATNAAELLERMRALVNAPGVQLAAAPYSFADLPALAASDGLEVIAEQFSEGEQILADALGVTPRRSWLYAPAGNLDLRTLVQLRGSLQAGEHSFLSASSLLAPPDPTLSGCPVPATSFVCPVEIETPYGPTTAFVADRVLQQRLGALAEPDASTLALQAFFAETAMIREERPGTEGRVIHVVLPWPSHPGPAVGERLLAGLGRAPWLRALTPRAALRRSLDPVPHRLVDRSPTAANTPDAVYRAQLFDARRMLDSFDEMFEAGVASALRTRLRRNLLVAHSRTWWDSPLLLERGRSYATQTRADMLRMIDRIDLQGAEVINFTSERGQVQFVVVNDTGFPIVVDLGLESPKLAVESLVDEPIPVGDHPVQVAAEAQSSGTFPLSVQMRSPGGGLTLATKTITIRSTNFNEVALTITVGAFAFLVLFYVVRAVRGRARRRTDEAAAA